MDIYIYILLSSLRAPQVQTEWSIISVKLQRAPGTSHNTYCYWVAARHKTGAACVGRRVGEPRDFWLKCWALVRLCGPQQY